MRIFKTKSGVCVEMIDNVLYTTNLEEVQKALEEDFNSNDIRAIFCAAHVRDLISKQGIKIVKTL